MSGTDILDVKEWYPLARFDFTHPFFSLNAHTIMYTWIALVVLIMCALIARSVLYTKTNRLRFLILSGIRAFINLSAQTIGYFSFNHCAFITSVFIFIAFCNCIAVIPWVEEATKDINTTLAMGIISFLYIQYYAIQTHGLWAYIHEYFTPIFIMAPLHLIGKISSVISMSFRLFGNIFGSSIILHIYATLLERSVLFQIVGLFGFNLVMTFFFIIFEGLLQAFVFTMLTITYLAIAVSHDQEELPQGSHS